MKLTRIRNRIQKDNNGITLVEVLIVVAILSIAVGMAGISVSLLYSRDSEHAAKTINTMLEKCRMNSLSREGNFTFELDTENTECVIMPDSDTEELPARVTYSLESEGGYDFSSNKVIEIAFDKSTGKVSGLKADGVSVDIKNVNLIRMNAVNLSGKRASVVLIVATGKHYVEYGS